MLISKLQKLVGTLFRATFADPHEKKKIGMPVFTREMLDKCEEAFAMTQIPYVKQTLICDI